MKISQRTWDNWFAEFSVIAEEHSVVYRMKNLFGEVQYTYDYEDLRPHAVFGKTGSNAYSYLAWIVLGAGILLATVLMIDPVSWIPASAGRVLLLFSLIISLLLFSIRLKKMEMVWFQTTSDNTAFSLRLDLADRKEVEKMVKFIKGKIREE